MTNTVSYFELHSQQPARVKEFYGSLFGWKLIDRPMPDSGTYTRIETAHGHAGGLMKAESPQMPSAWVIYVGVADLAASTRKVRELGGTVLQERIEIPNQGAYAVVSDPTGAIFNLWEKAAA